MQHTQLNVVKLGAKAAGLLFLLTLPALAAGTIAQPSKPDPLLDGGPTAACAAGADYAAGTDTNGRPVVPADVAAPGVPVPDAIAIPLAQNGHRGRLRPTTGDSAYVSIDGRKLAPLLNPPSCRN
jgi:hypothetical protein